MTTPEVAGDHAAVLGEFSGPYRQHHRAAGGAREVELLAPFEACIKYNSQNAEKSVETKKVAEQAAKAAPELRTRTSPSSGRLATLELPAVALAQPPAHGTEPPC